MKITIIILISLLIIYVSGCVGQTMTTNTEQPVNIQPTESQPYAQTTESGKTIEFVQIRDRANGYVISKPVSWFSGIKDNKYIEVSDNENQAIIWPVILSGNYTKANAIDMANYLVGQLKKEYNAFSIESVHKSTDNSFIELIATYEKNGIEKRAVYAVLVKNNAAFMTSYSSSKNEFIENEPVLRKIISSYKMTEPELKTVTKKIELVDWSDPEASMTGKIPKPWTAKLASQCETRSIRIYDENNPANQIFIYPMLGPIYTTSEARDFDRYYRDVYGWTQLIYADNPVISSATPRSVLEQALPQIFETTYLGTYFPWSPNLGSVEILHEEPANAEITSLFSAIGGDSAGMIFYVSLIWLIKAY